MQQWSCSRGERRPCFPSLAVFAGNGTRVIQTSVRSPQANSHAERFLGTLRRECLNHVLILNERHLCKLLAQYVEHHSGHRPHQSLQQEPPLRQPGRVDVTVPIEASPGRRRLDQGIPQSSLTRAKSQASA